MSVKKQTNKKTGHSSPTCKQNLYLYSDAKNNTLSALNFGFVPAFCNFIFHTVHDAAMMHLFWTLADHLQCFHKM